MTAKIYTEGGGQSELVSRRCREAWHDFFERSGLKGRMPAVVAAKGRDQAIEMFRDAVASPRATHIPMLLVDSDGPIAAGQSAWSVLESAGPAGAGYEQVFLMVQVMETWILADRDSLRGYFGASLNEGHLPAWPDLEAVPKTDVLGALERATASCSKRYSKGKVAFEVLARLTPAVVEEKCPHARRLLDRLRGF